MSERRLLLFTLCVYGLTLGLATPAAASSIILSGDTNIAHELDGSFGLSLDPDTQLFFTNVLGTGTSVVVQSTTGTGSPGGAVADTVINTFYDNLAGVSSSLVSAPITAATLTGADLFVGVFPDAAYTAPEIAALSAFLNGGGDLFLLGDNEFGFPQIDYINALLVALGSSMSIVPDALVGASPVVNPLTAGVGGIQYLSGSTVTGGTPLFLSGSTPVIAVEQLGSAPVPEPASLTLLGLGLAGMAGRRWRQRKAS